MILFGLTVYPSSDKSINKIISAYAVGKCGCDDSNDGCDSWRLQQYTETHSDFALSSLQWCQF